MAVNLATQDLNELAGGPAAASGSAGNDPFSFWKLPESWRSRLEESIEASTTAAEHYLFERYLPESSRRPPSMMGMYYRVKKFIPAGARHRLNSIVVRARRRYKGFPSWPCESALINFWREWLARTMTRLGVFDEWHVGFWPGGKRCCVVLTHDVDSKAGFKRMERMADLEERYGLRSAWNLPLSQYPLDWSVVERLRRRGFEFGAHGLNHGGRLFRSRADFEVLMPLVEQLAREHDLAGFRAPSTLRCAEWIGATSFEYDSSFADTDPYEPQPGGTCSLFPFHLGRLIELPYTLPQDHTLIHILRRSPLECWTVKAHWIASLGAMVLTLVHPDYCGGPPHLDQYEELLKRLLAIEESWYALPREAAAWWRRRAAMTLEVTGDDRPLISGPDPQGAVARKLSDEPLADLEARWRVS